MRRTIATLLLAGLAGAAEAQYRPAPPPAQPLARPYAGTQAPVDGDGYDAGYDDPGYDDRGYGAYGYAPPPRPQAPSQGGQPRMPAYQDDERWGTTESYGSADARAGGARTDDATAEYRRQQQDYRRQLDDYHRRMRGYRGDGEDRAARAADLRARAAACERGDDAACD